MELVQTNNLVGTLQIKGSTQHTSLLPLVFLIDDDTWRHNCLGTDRPTSKFNRIPPHNPRIDENIPTMVEITTQRDCQDTTTETENYTDEEKLQNQTTDESVTDEFINLTQSSGYCARLATVEDTHSDLVLENVPYIKIGGMQLASWIDIKELLFPDCSGQNCCIVLDCIMKKFAYPSNLKRMHPCSECEQKLFLRQFKLVFQGCILICLSDVQRVLGELREIVEEAHLQYTTRENACQYNRCDFVKCLPQRPQTAHSTRKPMQERPRSAGAVSSLPRHSENTKRLFILPELHQADDKDITSVKSSVGTELNDDDSDDIHFPVILTNQSESIVVPCSILVRVYPQSHNVVLRSLLSITSHSQPNQTTFTACSAYQAIAFNRWIKKYIGGSKVQGITTGSLMITLEAFCCLTPDILPTSTRRSLNSRCIWNAITQTTLSPEILKNPLGNLYVGDTVQNEEAHIGEKASGDKLSTIISDIETLHNSNHNAGEIQDMQNTTTDDATFNENKSYTIPDLTSQQPVNNHLEVVCVPNKVFQISDRKIDVGSRYLKKGQLKFRKPPTRIHTANDSVSYQNAKSSFSISASQISAKKTPRLKSARRVSKSKTTKSPYLSQPVFYTHDALYAKAIDTKLCKNAYFKLKSHLSETIAHKIELWPKAHIEKPPSVLRVTSNVTDSKASSPRSPCGSATTRSNCGPAISQSPYTVSTHNSRDRDCSLSVVKSKVANSPEKQWVVPYNSVITSKARKENEILNTDKNNMQKKRHKRKFRSQRSTESISSSGGYTKAYGGIDQTDSSLESLALYCKHDKLQSDPLKTNELEDICIEPINESMLVKKGPIKIPTGGESEVGDDDGILLSETAELDDNTDIHALNKKQSTKDVYKPVPSWEQFNLQLNTKHPLTEIYKMYAVPQTSPISSIQRSKSPDDISLSASSSKYETSSSSSIKTNLQKTATLYLTESCDSTSSTDSSSSTDEQVEITPTPIHDISSQDSPSNEMADLRVDGLINALSNYQATTQRAQLENILGYCQETADEVGDARTVISLASDLIKSNYVQKQPLDSGDIGSGTVLDTVNCDKISTSNLPDSPQNENGKYMDSVECHEIAKQTHKPSDTSISINVSNSIDVLTNHTKQPNLKTTHLNSTISNITRPSRQTPYKGSALKLSNDLHETNKPKLSSVIPTQNLIDGTKSLITPLLLNMSRFRSIGNVVVSTQTIRDAKDKELKAKQSKIKSQVIRKSSPEKRIEHIKINSSIELRPQCEQLHKSKSPKKDELKNDQDNQLSFDVKLEQFTDAVEINNYKVKPVRIQYDVPITKATGVGHFPQNYHRGAQKLVRKSIGAQQNPKVPINHFRSKSTIPNGQANTHELFQEIVTNSSVPYSKIHEYLKLIPSDNDYQMPPSSPNLTFRSTDSTNHSESCIGKQDSAAPVLNLNSRPKARNRKTKLCGTQYCQDCVGKRNKPTFKYTNRNVDSLSCSTAFATDHKTSLSFNDNRCPIIDVRDSISHPVSVQIYQKNKLARDCDISGTLKRQHATVPLDNVSRLADNLSVISLHSPEHVNQYKRNANLPKSHGQSTELKQDLSSKPNLELSKTGPNKESKSTDNSAPSNVVNVVFEYQPKSDTPNVKFESKATASINRSKFINSNIHNTPQASARRLAANKRPKLRICIDLVGSSEEDSPLEIKKIDP